jgi:short subunit dehydrogenase-like uncharacterized protein
VSRGLAAAGFRLRVAGRNGAAARRFAASLGPRQEGVEADVTSPASCRAVLAGCRVAVACAGPFDAQGEALLAACVDGGCHYVDIAEDRAHAARVRGWGPRFAAAGLTAACGCSSLPGLSEALALRARRAREEPPRTARVVLFIGNDNAKGRAAVAALARTLGCVVSTPQGPRRALSDLERISLPAPFGQARVVTFDSPEYDLLPARIGVAEVHVQVGFELAPFTALLPLLSWLAARGVPAAALVHTLARLGGGLRFGSSGGVVAVDLTWPGGATVRAAAVAERDGQHMAALPCVAVATALGRGGDVPRGAVTATQAIGAEALLAEVETAGFRVEPGP